MRAGPFFQPWNDSTIEDCDHLDGIDGKKFDRDKTIKMKVPGFINHAHVSLTEELINPIM
jgi:hypothetical protein